MFSETHTFTCMHLADAFIQSDLVHSGYTFFFLSIHLVVYGAHPIENPIRNVEFALLIFLWSFFTFVLRVIRPSARFFLLSPFGCTLWETLDVWKQAQISTFLSHPLLTIMEETANSVARPCRKRRVKRKVRLNKLSHAHLAGFYSLFPRGALPESHYTDVADFGLMQRKRGMGAWSLPAFPLPEFHWACQRRGGGRKGDSRRDHTVIIVTYIIVPPFFSPPSKFVFLWDFPLSSPPYFQSPPNCEVFERHSWPRILSVSAFSRLYLCLNCADHHHCVGNVLIFTDFEVDVQFEQKMLFFVHVAFSVLNLCLFCMPIWMFVLFVEPNEKLSLNLMFIWFLICILY